MAEEMDRITPAFTGKNILITGGSGFLGKVLVEKFLRVIPNAGTIYLLVRTKKGRDPQSRLEDIFSNPIFDQVKEARGVDVVMKQCRIVGGDMTAADLALSDSDRAMLCENVSIIYHCAATIRFDETLKTAVILNTRGTKAMLDLAKQCKRLEMFGHMSTAYCHLNEKLLLEKPYPPPSDPHNIIKAVELLDDHTVHGLTEKILGTAPNTYAYTKALSEALVAETMDTLPSVIFRPSIIIPIWKEPLPGWTDNINGPTGLLIAAGKGVIRTMYCDSDGYGDFLPVDLGVNAVIVATWNYIANKDYSRRIYHLVSSAEIKTSWAEVIDIGRWIVKNKIPLNGVLWYPGGSMKKTRLEHNICALLFHWIPAIMIDCLLYILGYPPVLCRVHRRIQKGFEVFEYYANNQWDFDNTNILYIRNLINDTERKLYKIDGIGVDIPKYFEECVRAARLYVLKEYDDTIPSARRHMKIMFVVDKVCKTLFVVAFLYYVGGWFFNLFFGSSTVNDVISDAIDIK